MRTAAELRKHIFVAEGYLAAGTALYSPSRISINSLYHMRMLFHHVFCLFCRVNYFSKFSYRWSRKITHTFMNLKNCIVDLQPDVHSRIEKEYSAHNASETLSECLDTYNDAFVIWRYAFEPGDKKFCFYTVHSLVLSLQKVCKDLYPDYEIASRLTEFSLLCIISNLEC